MADPALRITVKRVRPGAADPLPLPSYATTGSAGMDLLADVNEPLTIAPGARVLVPTGLIFEIPVDFEAQIRPRSGLALRHGITLPNAPGTIDSDYRGEVQVILANLGSEPFTVERGDRIAQMIVAPVVRAELHEVIEVSETQRGKGGFGHTGR